MNCKKLRILAFVFPWWVNVVLYSQSDVFLTGDGLLQENQVNELKPVLIGAVTQQTEVFLKIVQYLNKQPGVFVQQYCSSERLIELVYDEKTNGIIRSFLDKLNKIFPEARFYEKEYLPIKQHQSCLDVIKTSF